MRRGGEESEGWHFVTLQEPSGLVDRGRVGRKGVPRKRAE